MQILKTMRCHYIPIKRLKSTNTDKYEQECGSTETRSFAVGNGKW